MMMTYKTIATGGVEFAVYRIDPDDPDADIHGSVFLGLVDVGDIDEDGQWIGDVDDIEAEATRRFELPPDGTFDHQ